MSDIVLPDRSKPRFDLKSGLGQDLLEVGSELREDRVADIAARMANRRRARLDLAVGKESRPVEGPADSRKSRNREDMPSLGRENPVNLGKGLVKVGDVFEGLGGQDQVKRIVKVGQVGEILGTNTVDDLAGPRLGVEVSGFAAWKPEKLLVQTLDPIELADPKFLSFWSFRPLPNRPGRGNGRILLKDHLGKPPSPELPAAPDAIARFLAGERFGQVFGEPP